MGTIVEISGASYYKRLNKVDIISPTDKPFENIYECFKAFKVKFRVGRTYKSENFPCQSLDFKFAKEEVLHLIL